MSNVPLADILTEVSETPRNSTTGALDNSKRTRAINRVLQDMQDYADWIATKRTVQFEFVEGLKEYSLEHFVGATCLDNDGTTTIPDFKSPYDLRFKSDRSNFQYLEKDEFMQVVRRNGTLERYNSENGLLQINYTGLASAVLHECDSLTSRGTVAVSGDASNLTLDEVNYEEGSGAFNFDTVAGTSLVLTINLTTPVDLETLENRAFLTFFADLPTITNLTSITAKFGSSATDYWTKTETRPASKADLTTGRAKWAFKWADATVGAGTPDSSAIDYIQITITFSQATTDTDFRIDDIRMSESKTMELEYFSKAMVETESGSMQLEFNADSVTQTDLLRGGIDLRRVVVQGTTYELFELIGGKSDRDRTDSYKKYERQLQKAFARGGYRVRRPAKRANFPGKH